MFYDKLLGLCIEHGTSPTAVAKAIGKASSAANKWKNGADPHAGTLLLIANYFNVPPSYFDDEPEQKESAPGADGTEGGAVTLLSLYNGFSAGDQAELLAYAQFLAQRAANRQDRRG